MLRSESVFDALYIVDRLGNSLLGGNAAEIHLFAYLACLLSLYEKKPASDWGYSFAGTRTGSPYSTDLEEAIYELLTTKRLKKERESYFLAPLGESELKLFLSLTTYTERRRRLEAACSSSLALPLGLIRDAISQEPTLRPSIVLNTTRLLLQGTSLELLYDQIESLTSAVGTGVHDLLVPATVWLTFLHGCANDRSVGFLA